MMLRLVVLCGLVTVLALAAVAQAEDNIRLIMVNGSAETMVTPDVAVATFAIQTQDDTVAEATEENNRITGRVIGGIERLLIPGLTMRSVGFNVHPVYEERRGRQELVGYRVINQLRVRIPNDDSRELSESLGRVIDRALTNGANRVQDVNFILANEQPVMRQLLAEATRDARETAQVMANAAGVQLGPLYRLSSTPLMHQPPTPVMAPREEAVGQVPMVAGPMTVRVMVHASYEIQ